MADHVKALERLRRNPGKKLAAQLELRNVSIGHTTGVELHRDGYLLDGRMAGVTLRDVARRLPAGWKAKLDQHVDDLIARDEVIVKVRELLASRGFLETLRRKQAILRLPDGHFISHEGLQKFGRPNQAPYPQLIDVPAHHFTGMSGKALEAQAQELLAD